MKNLQKSILVLCLCAFTTLFAQNVPEVHFDTMGETTPIEELTYEYLLAHKVFLREKPSLKAKKLTLLDIGTPMVLREESVKSLTINGIKSNWYRVDAGELNGWVWGGMIAQRSFGSEADYRVKFVYGYESSALGENGRLATKYQLRAFKNGRQLDKIVLDSLAAIPSEIENIGNKGIFNVEDIITLGLVDARSGIQIGTSYVFWNNGKFTNIANLVDHADASYAKTESFVFPSDMNGIRSTVKLKTTIVTFKMAIGSELPQTDTQRITSFYTWNGYRFAEKESDGLKSGTIVANSSDIH